MGEMFPDAKCELTHESTFQLLIAVILSAQTTDVSVNKVTPSLFKKFPTADLLATALLDDIVNEIRSIGLYRNKAKNIKACSMMLIEEFNGEVPNTMDQLLKLPGVGRKTADVVLADAFNIPAIAVDTHVERVSKRLGICSNVATVLEVEQTLMKKIPKTMWITTHHRMIFFGRYQCLSRNPKCSICPLTEFCIYYKKNIN